MSIELYIEPLINNKRAARPKINWTESMIDMVVELFPVTFNNVLAKKLNVSQRSLIRKARELGIEKEDGFLEKRRDEISAMAKDAPKPPQPTKGVKGFVIPNSEQFRFRKGYVSPITWDRNMVEKIHKKRNETIRIERLRIKYGLQQKTRLRLVN